MAYETIIRMIRKDVNELKAQMIIVCDKIEQLEKSTPSKTQGAKKPGGGKSK